MPKVRRDEGTVRGFLRMLGRAIGCRRGAGAVTLRRSEFGAVGGGWRRCSRRRMRGSVRLRRAGCSPGAHARRLRCCVGRRRGRRPVAGSGKTMKRGYGGNTGAAEEVAAVRGRGDSRRVRAAGTRSNQESRGISTTTTSTAPATWGRRIGRAIGRLRSRSPGWFGGDSRGRGDDQMAFRRPGAPSWRLS